VDSDRRLSNRAMVVQLNLDKGKGKGKGKVVSVLFLTEHHATKTYWE
jgi:hypothetical protein